MLAVVPVRALAAVTTGFCPFAHHHGAGSHDASLHAHDSRGGDAPAHPEHAGGCDSCVEHCSSATFATPALPAALVAAPAAQRCLLQERFAAGFVPDQLDPPPLVL